MAHEHKGECKEVFAMLSEYLDAELEPQTCEELEAHLADCPPCIEFLKSLRRTVGLCKNCEPSDPPPPLSPEQREQLAAAYRNAISKGKKDC